MSLRDQGWWTTMVERLRFESLASLSREYNVSADALEIELAKEGRTGPAQLAPWWPEARRLRMHISIREIARRFNTNPRRLRRALARTALRVGGIELRGNGVPSLSEFRQELGRTADHRIAANAKVPVEAVQGERRRLHIPAFKPSAGYGRSELSLEDEAWILGPVRPKREKPKTDAGIQVVRRPNQSDKPQRPELEVVAAMAPEAPAEPTTPTRRVVRPAPTAAQAPVVAAPPANAPTAHPGDTAMRTVVRPTTESERPSRLASFWREKDRPSIDTLILPRRERDGRKRIIRSDLVAGPAPVSANPTPILVEEEEQAQAQPQRVRRQKQKGWREVSKEEIEQVQRAGEAAGPLPQPAPLGELRGTSLASRAAIAREGWLKLSGAVGSKTPERVAPKTTAQATPERRTAPPASVWQEPRIRPAEAVVAPVAAAVVAPAVVAANVPMGLWRINLSDEDGIIFQSPSMDEVIALLAAIVPPEQLLQASLERLK